MADMTNPPVVITVICPHKFCDRGESIPVPEVEVESNSTASSSSNRGTRAGRFVLAGLMHVEMALPLTGMIAYYINMLQNDIS
ncbi:unnamed protein product [Arabis nemorensis]|uniref:Uncharacterized protein n=1 Tax=Arabis nemorensis TaxID=586526 RepID=A0A565BPV5_9BRAS|nr:unnamed protein product [Arabis nemorensis]